MIKHLLFAFASEVFDIHVVFCAVDARKFKVTSDLKSPEGEARGNFTNVLTYK